MSEKDISGLEKFLVDEDYSKLLTFCIEPKQWSEISKQFTKQSKIFQMLKDLKTINALEFNGGTYKTTTFARRRIK